MWKLDDKLNIQMTKGDTPSFKINLTTKDEDGNIIPYVVKEDDVILFAVKQSKNSLDILIQLEIPHDTMILKIPENQTKYLGLGEYVYEISINNDADDFHDTFVAERKFELMCEVY